MDASSQTQQITAKRPAALHERGSFAFLSLNAHHLKPSQLTHPQTLRHLDRSEALEKDLPVPSGFISSRRREVMRQAAERDRAKEEARQALEAAYMRWVDGKRQEALAERYSGEELEAKLSEVIK